MATVNDLWSSYLQGLGYTGNLPDMVQRVLTDQTGVTSFKSIPDLWALFYAQQGVNGTYEYLLGKGYMGDVSQMIYDSLVAEDFFPGGSEPATACPYIMASEDVPAFDLSEFDVFTFSTGTAEATLDSSLGSHIANAAAEADYTRLQNPTPGDSHWATLLPGSGKVAAEMELTQFPDTSFTMGLSGITGNALDGNFAEVQARFYSDSSELQIQTAGVGARLLVDSNNTYSHTPVQGDRVCVIVDTDTGQADIITPAGHENFGGAAVIDFSDGAGFVFSGSVGGTGSTDSVTRLYTKASDFTLPTVSGVTDSCGTAVTTPTLVTQALDASEAEIQGAGLTGKLDNPTLAEQRGTYTVPATPPGWAQQYVMVRSPSSPGFVRDLSTGAVAMEFEVDVPDFTPDVPVTGSNLSVISMGGEIVNAINFSRQFSAAFVLTQEGDKFFAGGADAGGTTGLVSVSGTKFRVGLLLDNTNSILRIWLDDVELTLNDDTLPGGSTNPVTPIITSRLTTAYANGAEGVEVAARLITDPYWFTTTFPAGSRDIDGNVFN